MPDPYLIKDEFLNQITEIVLANISNEQFGVSELAQETGMSRSNLLRKVTKLAGVSASQLIRQIRLQRAMEMLKESSLTVSEISYQVGFNSTSYFIKCFREYYGYPPGKADKRDSEINTEPQIPKKSIKWIYIVLPLVLIGGMFAFILIFYSGNFNKNSSANIQAKKSIAVLPFINDSSDSTNVYIINGLMEATLNNLQKIKDLRVISRTSVEKYRNAAKTIPEIADELRVNYVIEGSGQKIGNQIMLNIQLIEGQTDKHLWSERYIREANDIFSLQAEVAQNIIEKIEVIITPEEAEMINKKPTENEKAYDYFLKGLECLNDPEKSKLDQAIFYYSKAIELDYTFARAYAGIAIAYYLKDERKTEKFYSDSINYFADKALFHDPELTQSLIAKALFYMNNGEYKLAGTYLEKALEYNPNSDLAFLFLTDLYVNYIPDAEKYLEYALRGLEIKIGTYDSIATSYSFLHISNSFIQSGFVDEAEKYINKSFDYLPQNIYSEYVKAYILYAREKNLEHLRDRLLLTLKKDTNRLDVLQEVGKSYYYLGDFENAYRYYKRFSELKRAFNLDIYKVENSKIGVTCAKIGLKEEADRLLEEFRYFAEIDPSIYKHLNLTMYYSYTGNIEKSIEHFKIFSEKKHYHYWTLLFLNIDPLTENIRNLPEYKKIYKKIETKFWDYHRQIRRSLEDKGLI